MFSGKISIVKITGETKNAALKNTSQIIRKSLTYTVRTDRAKDIPSEKIYRIRITTGKNIIVYEGTNWKNNTNMPNAANSKTNIMNEVIFALITGISLGNPALEISPALDNIELEPELVPRENIPHIINPNKR